MKELVIISGKGGTGKTSLTASFAALASSSGKAVFADCDVDAADLHLVFAPEIRQRNEFISGLVARVAPHEGSAPPAFSEKCAALCRFDAIVRGSEGELVIEEGSCEGCGVCARFCPNGIIGMVDRRCGEWYVSDTRFGTLVHAELDSHAENSGKLVTTVRKEAKRLGEEQGADWIIVDGSPGIGCPVISSITGANAVVIVTEPTVSGIHDLERVAGLARHFSIPFYVCVNKADVNPAQAGEVEAWCGRNAVPFLGRVPYDRAVTRAQIAGKSIPEYSEPSSDIHRAIAGIWEKICQLSQ